MERTNKTLVKAGVFFGCMEEISICDILTYIKGKNKCRKVRGRLMATKTDRLGKTRLGETRIMNCGMEATIIRYNTSKDFDVRFEDGTIATCKDYRRFRKGGIAHPSTTAEGRLGETRMMSCGMKATIIRYENADDINICFEDGKVVEHKTYNAFEKGRIAHRSLSQSRGSKDFHGFICKQGFIDEDRTLYECICKYCGLEDVLTPQEMMEHEKLEHGKNK